VLAKWFQGGVWVEVGIYKWRMIEIEIKMVVYESTMNYVY